MKRYGTIFMVAVVVFALMAGPAFASLCASAACDPALMRSMDASSSCPTKTGAAMTRSACTITADRSTNSVVLNQAGPDLGLPATPLDVVRRPKVVARVGSFPHADARGAPHMTSVIRI